MFYNIGPWVELTGSDERYIFPRKISMPVQTWIMTKKVLYDRVLVCSFKNSQKSLGKLGRFFSGKYKTI